jgi:hypothetical protein
VVSARAGTVGCAGVRWRAVLALAAVAGLLAGCSRTLDARADPGASTSAAPTAAAGRATAPSAPTDTADPVERLRAALLGPADVGPGWAEGLPPVPDPSTPAPCGGPGTVARFPDALRVGSTVTGPVDGFIVQEALSVYGDADTAQAAFRAGVAGLDCGQGTLHGEPVVITPAEDLQVDVGGDRASGWQVGSDATDAVLVLVQAREAVFTFAYVAPAGTAPADRADPLALTRTAVQRVLAA